MPDEPRVVHLLGKMPAQPAALEPSLKEAIALSLAAGGTEAEIIGRALAAVMAGIQADPVLKEQVAGSSSARSCWCSPGRAWRPPATR